MWDICEYIAQLMANRVQQSAEISKWCSLPIFKTQIK